jgi:hypothetical protein
MIVPEHFQAIRIRRALLLALLATVAGCGGDDVVWTDPLTMSTASDDARLTVDTKGRARLVADTSVGAHSTEDSTACEGSVRAVRLDDGALAAAWWSVRPDSSAVLVAALSADGGASWRNVIRVDTVDVSSTGCNRPAPAIAGSAGFVHLTYAMRATEGVGIFYAHSMNDGRSYEPPVTIVYGDRLTRTDVAAEKGTVAVAYEDPSGSRPQIGLAISRDWGHIFRDRIRGSTGVGAATSPQVSIAGREIAVSWLVGPIGSGSGGLSDAGASRIVRVGRLQ